MKYTISDRDGVLSEIDDNDVLLAARGYVVTLNGYRAGDRSRFDDERVELARIDAMRNTRQQFEKRLRQRTGPTIKSNPPPHRVRKLLALSHIGIQ